MKKIIKIGKEFVEVSEEIYELYYKMERRNRYFESDIKVGSSKIDPNTGEIKFIPSKEDSIERIMEKGKDFSDSQDVEGMVCDKAMLLILQEAMKELDEEEARIIDSIYFKNLTTRDIGKLVHKSHVSVGKSHKKILDKLRKYFL